jgi:hypothetical protein
VMKIAALFVVVMLLALLLPACDVLFPTPVPVMTDNLENPEIGVRYDYVASTHCGLRHLRIDGQTWVPAARWVQAAGE